MKTKKYAIFRNVYHHNDQEIVAFVVKEKFLWFWVTPNEKKLSYRFGLERHSEQFNTREEAIAVIKEIVEDKIKEDKQKKESKKNTKTIISTVTISGRLMIAKDI